MKVMSEWFGALVPTVCPVTADLSVRQRTLKRGGRYWLHASVDVRIRAGQGAVDDTDLLVPVGMQLPFVATTETLSMRAAVAADGTIWIREVAE